MPAPIARRATRRSSWPTGATSSSPICGSAMRSMERNGVVSIGGTCTPRCSHTGRPIKPAYRVALEDGTELVASGDHRFLSDRGWKHVTGAEQGADRRPHLTLSNKLMGVGQFAPAPADTPDYRRGYLCGLIRGDGHLGSYSYDRPGRSHGDVHRFRLALADFEALRRAARSARRRVAGHRRVRVSAGHGEPARDNRDPHLRPRQGDGDQGPGPVASDSSPRLVQGLPRGDIRCRGQQRRRHPDREHGPRDHRMD